MKHSEVKGKTGDFAYEGKVFTFETLAEYREYLTRERKSKDVNKDVLKAVNDYEGRRQRQNLRTDANPSSGGTGAREIQKGVKGALEAGVTPDELSQAIANLKAKKS